MANHYKVLGQQNPAAATSTTLYTCPGSTETVISVITVCNQSNVPTSFRLGIDVDGAGDDAKDYTYYDVPIGGNETLEVMKGVTLDAADLIRCYCTLATVSFGAFGEEIS